MNTRISAAIGRFLHFTQRHLLGLLLSTYVLGALFPALGLRLRGVHVGTVPWPGEPTPVSLPMLMLGSLLVVAGLGAKTEELRHVLRRPATVLAGLGANAIYPIVFAAGVALALRGWHDPEEVQNVLVGLALIGAMPIAGSSTAWSQNSGGNLALSLGLVLGSTLLSPLLTPLGLHAIGHLTHGDYSEDLHELAAQGSSSFVVLAVVIPSALGLLLRRLLGPTGTARALPALKLLNLLNLLLLNYTNAADALPQTLQRPDWDFLGLILIVTGLMCAGAFATGWLLPRALRNGAGRADRAALMFGLGMNNNGTGLVLASAALADHPRVLLPIIGYNLVQQVVAGLVDHFENGSRAEGAPPGEARGSSWGRPSPRSSAAIAAPAPVATGASPTTASLQRW
jgi:BASS family bile acid:Na+ symporter